MLLIEKLPVSSLWKINSQGMMIRPQWCNWMQRQVGGNFRSQSPWKNLRFNSDGKLADPFTKEQAKDIAHTYIEAMGNPRLKLGPVIDKEDSFSYSSAKGNRTPATGVRGRRPNRQTMAPEKHLKFIKIFPQKQISLINIPVWQELTLSPGSNHSFTCYLVNLPNCCLKTSLYHGINNPPV